MIALWMLYSIAVATLLLGAAALGERVARALGQPTRWAWLAALALGLLLPAMALFRHSAAPTAVEPARVVAIAAPPSAGAVVPPAAPVRDVEFEQLLRSVTSPASPSWTMSVRETLSALDHPLLVLWVGVTALLGIALIISSARLGGRRHEWRADRVAGVDVLVARDLGPAVVGALRPRIVLPRWALALDGPARALVVAHETEHLRAHDSATLALAVTTVVLCPWNAALWYAWQRLRLAVEIDCDARVLATRPDVERYGALLLDVGRRARRGSLLAAALAEGPRQLERRIVAMTERRPRTHRIRSLVSLGGAAVLLAAACAAPHPTQSPLLARRLAPNSGDSILYDSLRARLDAQRYGDAGADTTSRINTELYEQLRRLVDTLSMQVRRDSGRNLYRLLRQQAASIRLDSTGRLIYAPADLAADRDSLMQALRQADDRRSDSLTTMLGHYHRASDSTVAADGGCSVNAAELAPPTLVILVPPNTGAGEVHLRRLTTASAARAGIDGLERGGVVIRTRRQAPGGNDIRCWSSEGAWRVRVSSRAFARPDVRLYLVSDDPVGVLVREAGGRTIVRSSGLDAHVDSAEFRWQAGGRNGSMTGWDAH